ncbi:hypothetical protein PPYR_04817 [Photinus pyralis]|uniref:Regucalcin n=1 Tax=Photinus pyralis TaxID=7054 RepID=A0A1Y1NKP7_PHOPY|nr:regucalcin-like [Photinus pyralis]XP_031332812.1 regucalcin-like [Photinus pyralis]XP_031350951.1 regucalcin-like [Photinus pyralis]XP_031350952.1 regucalcin-like [Photinus pyralis]KAB0795139.1 hypothetical protein PPYR_11978 [Photinus pyralis]KAB0802631.1 hypothetical protein PPYR_04817 [Photinus pyralis]
MAPVIEKIRELGCFELGEGPHWDNESQSLYWVDIVKKTIHKYIPSLKKHTHIKVDKFPSLIVPISGSSDRFIITLQREVAVLTWDGVSSRPTSIETIAIVDTDNALKNNRINDGKVDPLGNLWAGTMAIDGDTPYGPRTGTLFCLSSNKKIRYFEENVGISNGLAWSSDLKKMYYIDSVKRRIDQYDFDATNASITNRQPLFSLEKHNIPGFPDGQTIDADGNLWVAVFRGKRVIKVSSAKPETLLDTVNIPDLQITSVAFGGPLLDELYVTSASHIAWPTEGEEDCIKGHIYKITGLGVRGLPANRIKI